MNVNYIIFIPQMILDIQIPCWIKHAFSYKKGLKGVLLTTDQNLARRYKSEESARTAAEAYNGIVKIV